MIALEIFEIYIKAGSCGKQAGAKALNRFSYQVCLSLLEIINASLTYSDFWAVLEFHEDFCLYYTNSSKESGWRLFQVKTKTSKGLWTLSNLLQKKGEKPSIFEKMVENKELVNSENSKAFFVSNKEFKFKFGESNKLQEVTELNLNELNESEKVKITEVITEFEIDNLKDFKCYKSSLSIDQTERVELLVGKITSFIREQFGDVDFAADAIVDSLLSEINRKSCSEKNPENVKDFVKQKGISKLDFKNLVSKSIRVKSLEAICSNARTQLSSEGVNFLDVSRIVKKVKEINSFRLANNEVFDRIIEILKVKINEAEKNYTTLNEIVEFVSRNYNDLYFPFSLSDFGVDDLGVKALVIYDYFKEER